MTGLTWESIAILGVIGLAGLIIISLFNLKVKWDSSKKSMSVESKPDTHDGCTNCSKLSKVLPLLIEESMDAGSKINSIKSMELLDSEMSIAKEHSTIIREKLSEVATPIIDSKNYFEEVQIIVGNVITIYIHTLEQTLMFSFIRNNWTIMSEVEFMDMVDRKRALLVSEWIRTLSVFFPSKRHSGLVETLKDIFTSVDPAFNDFQRLFKKEIELIFKDTRLLKNRAEDKAVSVRRQLSDSIMTILKANNFTS